MKLIINHTSMVPIYEQIVDQIKKLIVNNEVHENDSLPSVRQLSRELRISALTVKKAYDILEEEGMIVTVHGKGSFVATVNPQLLAEEQYKQVEKALENAIQKGRRSGLDDEEIRRIFELLMEE